jgi:beta-galactosidase
MKKIYSPLRVKTTTLSPASTFTVEVENRYTYTNLNELRINWQFGNEKGVAFVDCPAGQNGQFTIDVQHPEQANGLYLSFVDPRGFVADEYRIPVGEQSQNVWAIPSALPTRLKEKKDRYLVSGPHFTCEVSRTNGQILSLKKDGKECLAGGPWLMALPLTGGGCYPNHNANTPIFNDLCTEWTVSSTEARAEGEDVCITVQGSYKEFKGNYTLRINASGEIAVSYTFEVLQDVNPRQWGLVFEAPASFDRTFWRRDGLWTVYPEDHISRPVGEAALFYTGLPETIHPRVKPSWAWSRDFNELGSNDFRSTRRNIWYAGLKNEDGNTVTAVSEGHQHWRSWLQQDRIRFLVADFVTPGDEMFLSSYYAPYRKPLKTGDSISGTVKLVVGESYTTHE